MHGPFQFFGTSALYRIFGDGDADFHTLGKVARNVGKRVAVVPNTDRQLKMFVNVSAVELHELFPQGLEGKEKPPFPIDPGKALEEGLLFWAFRHFSRSAGPAEEPY